MKICFYDYEKNEHPDVIVRELPELSVFKIIPESTNKEKIVFSPPDYDYSTEKVYEWLRETMLVRTPKFDQLPAGAIKD